MGKKKLTRIRAQKQAHEQDQLQSQLKDQEPKPDQFRDRVPEQEPDTAPGLETEPEPEPGIELETECLRPRPRLSYTSTTATWLIRDSQCFVSTNTSQPG